MKITKQCPECGGREIYTADSSLMGHASAVLPNAGSGFFSFAKIEIYVCGNCGFYQTFVEPQTLAKVKENYTRYS